MSEKIRILLDGGSPVNWPKRCPHCGETEDIVMIQSSVEREKFSYWITHLTVVTEKYTLNFPSCRRHAFKNEMAINILKQTTTRIFVRALFYVLFAFAIHSILVSGRSLHDYLENKTLLFLYSFIFLGMFAIFWAARNGAVIPLRLDTDKDVAIIRFLSKTYARDFKRANTKATHHLVTAAPIFFLRPLFWKIIIVLIFILFLFKKLSV